MNMLVFETFYCTKKCADGCLRKFKLSFVGDENLYYTTEYQTYDTGVVGENLLCILDGSVSADYNAAYEVFKREKEHLLGLGFVECKSMKEKTDENYFCRW